MQTPLPPTPIDWETIAPMLIGLGMFVILPIIWLLLHHQRKMTELVHGERGATAKLVERIERMQTELVELKTRLHDHILRLDDRERALDARLATNSDRGQPASLESESR